MFDMLSWFSHHGLMKIYESGTEFYREYHS